MKNLRTRILILCGLMVLSAAALAPIVVQAGCPQVIISCSDGSQHSCNGTHVGNHCEYDYNCMNC